MRRARSGLSLQVFQIREILRTPNRTLVSDKIFPAQNEHRHAIELRRKSVRERFIYGEASKACEKVEAIGWTTQLDYLSGLGEISLLEFGFRESKFS
jgi:hypothetical protein